MLYNAYDVSFICVSPMEELNEIIAFLVALIINVVHELEYRKTMHL